MPYFTVLKNATKKFLDLDPDVDDFHNLSNSFLSKDTSLVKFF